MDPRPEAAQALASKVTYVASGSAVLFGMTANEVAAIGGLIVAIIALVVNTVMSWHFKSKHLKIAMENSRKSPFPSIYSDDD